MSDWIVEGSTKMQKLQRAYPEKDPQKLAEIMEDMQKAFPDVPRAELQKRVQQTLEDVMFLNDVYQVNVRRMDKSYHGSPVIWLSIKRRDKQPCHDWRDFQEIKNQIVGPECEGIELYPAESRVADTANQYHLWVIADPKFRWPLGFPKGLRYYKDDARHSRQRPLDASGDEGGQS